MLKVLSALRASHASALSSLHDRIAALEKENADLKSRLLAASSPPPPAATSLSLPTAAGAEGESLRREQQTAARLIERAVPARVVARGREVVEKANGGVGVHETQAVVAIIDIKGFTGLSERFAKKGFDNGTERFSAVVNAFFTDLIILLHRHHGQIESFNGDAVVVLFYADERLFPWSFESLGNPLQNPLRYALQCFDAIRTCGKFTPWRPAAGGNSDGHHRDDDGDDDAGGVELRLHGALAVGQVKEVYVGGWGSRFLSLAMSDCFAELSAALDAAGDNEYVLAPSAMRILEQVKMCSGSVVTDANGKFVRIQFGRHLPTFEFDESGGDAGEIDSEFLSRMVPSAFFVKRLTCEGVIRGDFFNERRFVSILFVAVTTTTPAEVHEVVVVIQKEMDRHEGTIRQLTQDDKGVVMICAFGFPFHVDDGFRAVHSALNITQQTQHCTIGVTAGECFAGCCGSSTERFEWSIIGTTVNMAARLAMKCKALAERVLVSEAAGEMCMEQDRDAVLDLQKKEESIKLKGLAAPVSVFTPRYFARNNDEEGGDDDGDADDKRRGKKKEEEEEEEGVNKEMWTAYLGNRSAMRDVRSDLTATVVAAVPTSPLVVIQGDQSGIGKTFMLSRVMEGIDKLHHGVFATTCPEDKQYSSYFALFNLVRDIVAALPALEVPPILLRAMAQQHSVDDDALGSYQRLQRIFDGVASVFAEASARLSKRLVLIIDNIHYADHLSLQFIAQRILRAAPGRCGFVVSVTKQEKENDATSESSKELKAILAQGQSFELLPFSAAQTQSFLASMRVEDLANEKALLDLAGGIPGNIVNVVSAITSGSTRNETQRRRRQRMNQADPAPTTPTPSSSSIETFIYSEIDKLVGMPYSLVKIASVLSLGDSAIAFPASLLQEVSGVAGKDELWAALQWLIDRRILLADKVQGETLLRFSNSMFARCVYKILTKSVREDLHRSAVHVLQRQTDATTDNAEFLCRQMLAMQPQSEGEVFETMKVCQRLALTLSYNGNNADGNMWRVRGLKLLSNLRTAPSSRIFMLDYEMNADICNYSAHVSGILSPVYFAHSLRTRELSRRIVLSENKSINGDMVQYLCFELACLMHFVSSKSKELHDFIARAIEFFKTGNVRFHDKRTMEACFTNFYGWYYASGYFSTILQPADHIKGAVYFYINHASPPLLPHLAAPSDSDVANIFLNPSKSAAEYDAALRHFEVAVRKVPVSGSMQRLQASQMEHFFVYAMASMSFGKCGLISAIHSLALSLLEREKQERSAIVDSMRMAIADSPDAQPDLIEKKANLTMAITIGYAVESLWVMGEHRLAHRLHKRILDELPHVINLSNVDTTRRWKMMEVLGHIWESGDVAASISEQDWAILTQVEKSGYHSYQTPLCDLWTRLGDVGRLQKRLDVMETITIKKSGEIVEESEYLRYRAELEHNLPMLQDSIALAIKKGCPISALRAAICGAKKFGQAEELRRLCLGEGPLVTIIATLRREREVRGWQSETLEEAEAFL